MKMPKDECTELFTADLLCTFSAMTDYVANLTSKLNEVVDILLKMNDTIAQAAFTTPSLEKFWVCFEDVKKILDFIDLYGDDSEYRKMLYAYEKIACPMSATAQPKVLMDD